ncbi:putative E3 ubiquitin-protein ligase RING1a [Diospyros lotus]|uniref:putative E3 ubiquitin-protein ligase RING1a n=1 Tax=Diospyros lotus TaxID=55363 RepID=UPI0022528ECD|nr:putative E3 ubiquitin-protein ligase RING1a [Diospyros lotus]
MFPSSRVGFSFSSSQRRRNPALDQFLSQIADADSDAGEERANVERERVGRKPRNRSCFGSKKRQRMPAQKRHSSSENFLHDEDSLQQHCRRNKQSRREKGTEEDAGGDHEEEEEDEDEEEEVKEEPKDQDPDGEDSDGSRSSDDPAKLPEWILVELPALRTYVQCPICLGIIKKTRTVMECLHRFCRECIDKSMRLGNNECPACRTHCASRRSLRDDPRFDSLIEILYEDIEKYEEEELAFHEDEKNRNKQIQASIAQILRRQSEALVTRSKKRKDKPLPINYRRRRRITRGTEHEGSEDNEDENNHDGNKDSSSNDERGTEIKHRRYRRRTGGQSSQPSPSAATSEGGGVDVDLEASRESRGTSSGPVRNPEMLAWGGGGARSKSVRNTRIMKLAKYLENLKENDDKLDVHLMLISLDQQRMPGVQQLHLYCSPLFSVEHLKEYVANKTQLPAGDIEILQIKKQPGTTTGLQYTLDPSTVMENKVEYQTLGGQETLAALKADCALSGNYLVLGYRLKD